MAATNRQRGAPPSFEERRPIDPRYPNPRDDGMANGVLGVPNAVSRSASQRQRPRNDDAYNAVATGYPNQTYNDSRHNQRRASYDEQYSHAAPAVSRSSRSFAARAGAVPQQTDTMPTNTDSYKVQSQQESSRGNEGSPMQIDHVRVRRPEYATINDSTLARQSSTRGNERYRERQFIDDSGYSTGQPRAAAPKRSATMGSDPMGSSDWAADRSPLQKLEVKLNDISKEEKRARVQEAERKLRESKGKETSRLVSQLQVTTQATTQPTRETSRRVVSDAAGSSRIPVRSRGLEPPMNVTSLNQTVRRNISDPAQRPRPRQIPDALLDAGETTTPTARRPSLASRSVDQTQRRRSSEGGRGDERAVRFQNDADKEPQRSSLSPQNERQAPGVARGSSMKATTVQRTGSIQRDDQGISVARYPDVVTSKPATHAHAQHLKHQLPPQTAAGIQTRRQIGFERDVSADEEHTGGHRFGKLLHRHNQEPGPLAPQDPSRRLEEWREGGVARLTLEDAVALAAVASKVGKGDKNVGWWEESPSQRRRSNIAEAEFTALDGAQEDPNGTVPPFYVLPRESSLTSLRNVEGAFIARQDIDDLGALQSERRNRSWFWCPKSRSQTQVDDQAAQPALGLLLAASAPLFKPFGGRRTHFLQSRVNQMLTKDMRAIRVRVPLEPTKFTPPLYLKCGPLLRYTGMKRETSSIGEPTRETWRGSIMIVTTDNQSVYDPAPTLRLFHQPMELLPPPPTHFEAKEEDLPYEYIDPVGGLPKMTRTGTTVYVKPAEDLDLGKDVSRVEDDDGLYEFTRTANVPTQYGKADELLGRSPLPSLASPTRRKPLKTGRFKEVKGVRLHAEHGVTFWRFNLEIELGKEQTRIAYRINKGASIGFWVPARGESMNLMFHTCNGFSMSVDSNTFSGPDPLWRDVLNSHQTKPFHVMIGGGDQIYNDAVMKDTHLFQEWLDIRNPHEKHKAEFTLEMQDELENFYLDRYSMWFSQGLFGMANSQIPMINIWDDHDIIDGYGSYPDRFMSTPVFCGLGNIAFKYYMLFQHQSVADEMEQDEPSWVLGSAPGPYISSVSRSVFVSLGKRMAFLGVDCRTERTRDEIVSESTYQLILDRCRREITRGDTRHLLVLLGVPIAYPRLVWLENVLTSRALDPLKALGRMGLLGNFMNKFDGGVEILDDLDDHWTAKNHKEERNWFIEELQALAAEKSVRITILSGDVHLAAIGQFYSNKTLKVPKDQDHRYMPNIISSAIVNTPPPDMVVDVLNKRNKIHHLNTDTDEDMIPMFTHDVDGKARNNKHLLPKRNWCSIAEYYPGLTPPPTPPSTLTPTESEESLPPKPPSALQRTLSLGGKDSKPAKLIRRLSLSNRPASYLDQSRSPSPDHENPNGQRENDDPPPQSRMASAPIPVRPVSQFHRVPTNLSQKAAAKGGGDPSHVDLEFGLDIKLNCEIKQGDPSGGTEGYRLLVPALHYGEAFAPFNQRRPSLIRRLTDASRTLSGPRYMSGSGSFQQSGASEGYSSSQAVNESANREAFGIPPAAGDYGVAARRPPYEVPARGPSLLRKKPVPFMPRPRPEISAPMPLQAPQPAPVPPQAPTSAPATLSQQSRAAPPSGNPPGLGLRLTNDQRGQDAAGSNTSTPVRPTQPNRNDDYDSEEEDTDYDSLLDDVPPAVRRRQQQQQQQQQRQDQQQPPRRGKFDASGVSKFFGAAVPTNMQAGAPPGGAGGMGVPGMMGSREGVQLAPDGLPVDAATSWATVQGQGKKKGWRKFF